MNIVSEKKALRRYISQLLKTFAPAENSFCEQYKELAHFEAYQNARSVFLYASLPEEAPARKLIELCLADNKITALPRVSGKEMDFFILDPSLPLSKQTQSGVFGIAEPLPACPLFVPSKKNLPLLVFVPGLAFDRQGFRLGRGKGYYDRYFADFCGGTRDKNITLVGLCRSIQIVPKVPAEAHDMRVDFIMSERRIEKTAYASVSDSSAFS
ncbi:5-formyltetrahydrofolate cyclo-ligase [Treponema sp. HNW]|uniref:5-formyltetrahydrofolate cyclo-ligase n=1 Tax=Treponema sp. HNW TaxID=3116654 RepID=UPI003D0DDD10